MAAWFTAPYDPDMLALIGEQVFRVLIVAACWFVARHKGRWVWLWCPLGYFGINFVLFILVLLPKTEKAKREPENEPPEPSNPVEDIARLQERLQRERLFLETQQRHGADDEALLDTEIWIEELEQRIKKREAQFRVNSGRRVPLGDRASLTIFDNRND